VCWLVCLDQPDTPGRVNLLFSAHQPKDKNQPNLSTMADQNTFQAIAQQPTGTWKNAMYRRIAPDTPNKTIALSGQLLYSQAL